jgi:pimeloyl-ACP methyl ester carboxylesterase
MVIRVNTLWQGLRRSLAVNPGRFAAGSAVSGPLGLLAVEAGRLAQQASTALPGGEILDVRSRTVDGTRVRYAESDGPAEPSILLTSPWPESLYAFAPIWSLLAPHARLVAVDLPGFGGSERRDELLSPSAMGAFLIRLIDEWALDRPHLVAPDIGTSAALFAAASRPGLLSSAVVGSGGAAVPIQLGAPLEQWVFGDLEGLRATDSRAIVGAALDTIEGYAIPPEIRADYLESYDDDRFIESTRYVRRYPDDLPDLARRLPEIETPVQIIAGRRDNVVPLANANFLAERLPRSKLSVVDAGHFVWEEAPVEYASIIAEWVTGGYRAGGD